MHASDSRFAGALSVCLPDSPVRSQASQGAAQAHPRAGLVERQLHVVRHHGHHATRAQVHGRAHRTHRPSAPGPHSLAAPISPTHLPARLVAAAARDHPRARRHHHVLRAPRRGRVAAAGHVHLPPRTTSTRLHRLPGRQTDPPPPWPSQPSVVIRRLTSLLPSPPAAVLCRSGEGVPGPTTAAARVPAAGVPRIQLPQQRPLGQ